jgi:hypothetical protein
MPLTANPRYGTAESYSTPRRKTEDQGLRSMGRVDWWIYQCSVLQLLRLRDSIVGWIVLLFTLEKQRKRLGGHIQMVFARRRTRPH